jgi:hypothetical protein
VGDRLYRPGSRNPKYRREGKFSENRVAWLKNFMGQFVIMRYSNEDIPEDAVDLKEEGPTYLLVLPKRGGGRPTTFNITSLTIEELQQTRRFFNELFDLAEPIVRHRDKVAQDAADEGDDSYTRYYREVPQYVVREGQLREHDQRILDRLAGVLDGAGADGSPDGGVRGDWSELASGESSEGEPEDDEPKAD